MIYLDHAATSFPKAPAVLAAMQHWFTDVGVSASRGAGDRCLLAAREVEAARAALGGLVDCAPARIAFVSGATEGLNLALRALLRPQDRVLTTAFEHSSVARPLRALQRERGLQIELLAPRGGALPLSVDDVRAALRALRPALFVFTHASNVTGDLFDAAAWCELAREAGAATLLDASQTAGHVDLRVGADVVVASGHKALGGPPGIGFVAARERPLAPQKQGGTGSSRSLDEHPTSWPEAFEAGTPNTPAIFGLAAALRLQTPASRDAGAAHARARRAELADGLEALAGVRVLRASTPECAPVLSIVHDAFDPAELGALLAAANVHVRTGHHCAPWLHRHLGTDAAGTVRFSTAASTTATEVRTVVDFVASLRS
jgi:selenocysteine lyase/cysteine desulfurase